MGRCEKLVGFGNNGDLTHYVHVAMRDVDTKNSGKDSGAISFCLQ
jgi:hypothetical protein